jgi:hypothetical protein
LKRINPLWTDRVMTTEILEIRQLVQSPDKTCWLSHRQLMRCDLVDWRTHVKEEKQVEQVNSSTRVSNTVPSHVVSHIIQTLKLVQKKRELQELTSRYLTSSRYSNQFKLQKNGEIHPERIYDIYLTHTLLHQRICIDTHHIPSSPLNMRSHIEYICILLYHGWLILPWGTRDPPTQGWDTTLRQVTLRDNSWHI